MGRQIRPCPAFCRPPPKVATAGTARNKHQYRDEVRANIATASNIRSTMDEYVQANTSMEQAASLGSFADKPLVVLTAGVGSDAAHLASQNDLAALSTNRVPRQIRSANRTRHPRFATCSQPRDGIWAGVVGILSRDMLGPEGNRVAVRGSLSTKEAAPDSSETASD
jgi:hypothetical protein